MVLSLCYLFKLKPLGKTLMLNQMTLDSKRLQKCNIYLDNF